MQKCWEKKCNAMFISCTVQSSYKHYVWTSVLKGLQSVFSDCIATDEVQMGQATHGTQLYQSSVIHPAAEYQSQFRESSQRRQALRFDVVTRAGIRA